MSERMDYPNLNDVVGDVQVFESSIGLDQRVENCAQSSLGYLISS